jgi:glycine/D-amino acid oxidase-like deaminating enzyme
VISFAELFDDNQAVWLAGAAPDDPAAPLARDLTADVAIIGGGFTGVSTAYHLSRRFPDRGVVLLEARRLGNGASGRNGGLMLNGVTPGARDDETALREYALTTEAMDAIEALIREHRLRVRYRRDGGVKLATTARSAEAAHAEVERLAARGLPLRFLRGDQLGEVCRARGAHGAVVDPGEGLLNGVDLIRALRPVLVAQGVQICEGTRVTRVREGATIELSTTGGTVRAKAIVLATNGYTPHLGYFTTGILPVISHVLATNPLPPDLVSRAFGTAAGFSDDLPRLAFAGVDPEGRLLIGGGSNSSYRYRFRNRTVMPTAPGDAAARAIRATLSSYLPDLASVPIAYHWSGPLGLTKARHCAMGVRGSHANVFYALGYSGHGVVLANLAGRVLADLYAGHHDPWRSHAFYMARPSGIPGEPLRWLGYNIYTKLTGHSPFKRVR